MKRFHHEGKEEARRVFEIATKKHRKHKLKETTVFTSENAETAEIP
jgi:hypothetical protein